MRFQGIATRAKMRRGQKFCIENNQKIANITIKRLGSENFGALLQTSPKQTICYLSDGRISGRTVFGIFPIFNWSSERKMLFWPVNHPKRVLCASALFLLSARTFEWKKRLNVGKRHREDMGRLKFRGCTLCIFDENKLQCWNLCSWFEHALQRNRLKQRSSRFRRRSGYINRFCHWSTQKILCKNDWKRDRGSYRVLCLCRMMRDKRRPVLPAFC